MTDEPILSVRDLKKHYPLRKGFKPAGRRREGGRRDQLRHRVRRDAGAGRRVRLREVNRREFRHPLGGADCRRGRVQRKRPGRCDPQPGWHPPERRDQVFRRGAQAIPPRGPDDLPRSGVELRPADDGRQRGRGDARDPRNVGPSPAAGDRRGPARTRRALRGGLRPIPPRVLRRPETADRAGPHSC